MHQTLDSGSKILLPESVINANRQSRESTKYQYFVGELSKSIFLVFVLYFTLSFYDVFYILSCMCVDVGAFFVTYFLTTLVHKYSSFYSEKSTSMQVIFMLQCVECDPL